MEKTNAPTHHVFVVAKAIPHAAHRYPTVGDYWRAADGTDHVRVSQFKDPRYEQLVLLHEMIEYFLCLSRNIAEEDIKAFDEAVPDTSPYADDPGHDPAAPYHYEHVFAECIERLVAAELGVNWQEYEAACLALFTDAPFDR